MVSLRYTKSENNVSSLRRNLVRIIIVHKLYHRKATSANNTVYACVHMSSYLDVDFAKDQLIPRI